jgi:hypothetical protein
MKLEHVELAWLAQAHAGDRGRSRHIMPVRRAGLIENPDGSINACEARYISKI